MIVEVDLPLQPTARPTTRKARQIILHISLALTLVLKSTAVVMGLLLVELPEHWLLGSYIIFHQPTQTLIRALHTFLVSEYNPSSTKTIAANLDTNENISIVIITKCGWLYIMTELKKCC
jgi:hypothetical protein